MFDPSPRPSVRAIVLALMLACAAAAMPAPAATLLVGRPAPDFALKSTDGDNLRLSEYRGQVVLLNFYARWAGESRVEMPALDRINTTYRRAGLIVLGVSVDEDLERAAEFAAAMHVSYPILLDADPGLGRAYRLDRMPVTMLIDRSGIVRYVKTGYERGDDRAFVAQIRELLRE